MLRGCTGHNKNSSNNTSDASTHRHRQMANIETRLIIFFVAEDGEALYSQQKQDQEMTVTQTLTPYCDIQTSIEESRENHWNIQV